MVTSYSAPQTANLNGPITLTESNMRPHTSPNNKVVFRGVIEVVKVSNGYIINVGRREGYDFETFIASTLAEVNERITACMVAFHLEDRDNDPGPA